MIYAYIGRNRKLCLRPTDPEGEDELKELLKLLKQQGLEAIDIETEMPENEYRSYQQQKQRYGYQNGQQSFGFNSPQSRYPQPPDFNPSMHTFPLIFPIWLGQGGNGGSGGSGGGSGGDSGGGSNSYRDSGNWGERGEYDGRENPRDTGRNDSPRR